jgi:uncharacterized membrane protein YbhN (UPF0104 family)
VTPERGDRGSLLRRAVGGVVGALLVGGVLWLAGLNNAWHTVSTVRPGPIAIALAAATTSLVFRGIRLSLLLEPGRLHIARAVPVAAQAQAAALFVPARLGELALPLLLRRETGLDGARGVGILLVARALDSAALGAWALWALITLRGGSGLSALAAAGALVLPLALLLPTLRWADAAAGRHGGLWADRVHRVRASLEAARSRPLRLSGAAAACLAMWASQWILTWWLLAAMGHRWPAGDVVVGAAAASLANLLPVNLVANLGTLEAGWTAAFAALGVAPETAAATGLAAHLWALVFAALLGAVGWAWLDAVSRRDRDGAGPPDRP